MAKRQPRHDTLHKSYIHAGHEKIRAGLHHRIEAAMWSRVLVTFKDPPEYHEAAAVSRGDARRKKESRAEWVSHRSLARRVDEVTTAQGNPVQFTFQLHDLSTTSAFIMNPNVWARGHGNYWSRHDQTDYYVNFIR